MLNKLAGSILLIVGTCIGAGMLALPLATAAMGFYSTTLLLLLCWFVMTMGALLLLEVNLWFAPQSHLVSMAKHTLGPIGQAAAWITNLLLFYSLLAAYIAGGSDLLREFISEESWGMSKTLAAPLFTFILGLVVYLGIRSVDLVNRGLMITKLLALVAVVLLLTPFVDVSNWTFGEWTNWQQPSNALMVAITSFGFAATVPSLRSYFKDDAVSLKRAVFWGSMIPLVSYIAWVAVVMGVIPLHGLGGLETLLHSEHPTGDLVGILNRAAQYPVVQFCVKLFTSICVVTSFLGVSIGLVDFIADGFRLNRSVIGRILAHLIAFLPPLGIALLYPDAFIRALEYGGIYCLILLVFLPAAMALRGRQTAGAGAKFQVGGGAPLLWFLMIFSVGAIVYNLINF